MTTVSVTHRPESPSGAGFRVMSAELIAVSAWTDDKAATVLGTELFAPDAAGLVTMHLRPNSELAQTDTYYRVRIQRSDIVYYCVVPDSGPVKLIDILVDPGTLNPIGPVLQPLFQLRSEKGQANGYAPLDGTGKVPTANLPASAGGGIESINGDVGPAVTLDFADVGAPPATRTITGTAGRIIGGGDLSANRVFDLHADVLAAMSAAVSAVQPAALATGLANRGVQAVASSGIKNVTFQGDTSSAWTLAPADYDVTIAASVGDVLLFDPSMLVQVGADAELDVVSVVGGLPARYYSTGTAVAGPNGHGGLYIGTGFNRSLKTVRWIVAAEDISGGAVTLALLRRNGSGVTFGHAVYPGQVNVTNLGGTP